MTIGARVEAKELRIPASANAQSFAVAADATRGIVMYRTCASDPCDPLTGSSLAIDLPPNERSEDAKILVEAITLAGGRQIVHVRVPAKGARGEARAMAWEALLAPGDRAALFSGKTGFFRGEDDEWSGVALERIGGQGFDFVVVGDIRADTTICGQQRTLLSPKSLDPKTLTWRGATVQRLARSERDRATPVQGTVGESRATPSSKLLNAVTSSLPGRTGAELTDGDLATAWTEGRPGDGHGEFVTMRASAEVPILSLAIAITPERKDLPRAGAAPKTFFLTSEREIFRVEVSDDLWGESKKRIEVRFPRPIQSNCLSLVLDQAYGGEHPAVTVAEITALSEFDEGADAVARAVRALSTEKRSAAAAFLKRAGRSALADIEKGFDSLDARGRSLAVDVALAESSCEEASPILVRGAVEKTPELATKAQARLQRCGTKAGPALASAFEKRPDRDLLALLFAHADPEQALVAIAKGVADGSKEARGRLRVAFAVAAKGAAKEHVVGILANSEISTPARVQMLRALEGTLPNYAPASYDMTILLVQREGRETRYLLANPLSEFARAGDARAKELFTALATKDAEWTVRARASALANPATDSDSILVQALRDDHPRVRQAAALALTASGASEATAPQLASLLEQEPWTFVRLAALEAFKLSPRTEAIDRAIVQRLSDSSTEVRTLAAQILGERSQRGAAGKWAAAIESALMERLADKSEEADVRSAAAIALAKLCSAKAVEPLTAIALAWQSPRPNDTAVDVIGTAVEALGAIHPRDLAARLGPLLGETSPPSVREGARRALSRPAQCGRTLGSSLNRWYVDRS